MLDGHRYTVVYRTRSLCNRPVLDADGAIERIVEFDVLIPIPHHFTNHNVPQHRVVLIQGQRCWGGGWGRGLGRRGSGRGGGIGFCISSCGRFRRHCVKSRAGEVRFTDFNRKIE